MKLLKMLYLIAFRKIDVPPCYVAHAWGIIIAGIEIILGIAALTLVMLR